MISQLLHCSQPLSLSLIRSECTGKQRTGNITETDNRHSRECRLEERDLTLCKQILVELRVAAKAVEVTNSQQGDGDAAWWIWPNNRDGNSFCSLWKHAEQEDTAAPRPSNQTVLTKASVIKNDTRIKVLL